MEIVDVVYVYVVVVVVGKEKFNDNFWEIFSCYFYICDIFDFDLVICMFGEICVSNFFFMQSVYVEFVFMFVFWFDFIKIELVVVVEIFFKCECCFGQISE